METVCGAKCDECKLYKNSKCRGCKITNSCPFGKKCWIAKYIEVGGSDNFDILKKQLINELNELNIPGMPKITDLYPLLGKFINIEYQLSNNKIKLLQDDIAYLGNQVECEFSDLAMKKYFGLVANMDFIMISEFNENGTNPELIIYKKR